MGAGRDTPAAHDRSRDPSAKPVVALVTDAIAPYHRGGKEQRYQELAVRLRDYADVHVYSMNWWQGPRTIVKDGVSYHAICRHVPLYRGKRRSIREAVIFALACFRLLFARFDVLEADHMPYLQLFTLKLVAMVRRKRLVITWHEVWDLAQWTRYIGPLGILAWRLEQLAVRLPDCIIAASAHTAEALSKRDPRAPVVVAPNGVDLELIDRVAPAEDPVEIISVGRLLAHKRFDLLLECVAIFARRGTPVRCRIIGDGQERLALAARARFLGIDHLVDLRLDVHTSAELISLIKAARVFVFPSEREGFGIAALEAMACGIPVVTTTAPQNLARHLVARSARGIACAPTAPALADAVSWALQGELDAVPGKREEWIREFDWTAMSARIAAALGAASAARTAPRATTAGPVARDGAERLARPQVPVPAKSSARGREVPPGPPQTARPDGDGRPRGATGRAALFERLASVAALGALAGLATVRGAWIAQAAELLLLLIVPGWLLLQALRTSPEALRGFPVYLIGGSVAVLMGAGLAVDLIGPPLGVARPLARIPLIVSICGTGAVLVVIAWVRRAPALLLVPRRALKLQAGWPLVLPAIAWAGAMRLNHGHGRGVAIAALACIAVALMYGAWRASRWSVARTAILVYAASLGLMWGFSMRGQFVYGFDISSEFRAFVEVLHQGRWFTPHHNDAYGAMLSLTILPTTIAELTRASPLLVLKVIYPAIFALFPVGVLLLAERTLTRRFAYIGVLFVVVQNYLFQQLPAIARQEIGLLMFICLLFAIVDARLARGARAVLIGVFALGLVLSHYGTAYLTIAQLAIALVLELARRLVTRGRLGRKGAIRVPLAWLTVALALTAIGAVAWYGPVTNSAQNFSSFVSDLANKGPSFLPTAEHRGVVQAYLSGNVTTTVSGQEFARLARESYLQNHRYRYIDPLPQAYLPAYRLRSVAAPTASVSSQVAVEGLDTEQVLITQLSILIAAVGALILWLVRSRDAATASVALLAVSTLGVLAFIRLSGTAAQDYNQSRAFLQAMVPLCICLGWVVQAASRPGARAKLIPATYVAGLGLMLLTTSGLRGPVVGGETPANVASSGEDYERFVVSAGDVAAAKWLARAAPSRDIVSADLYAQRRMSGITGRPRVFGVLTPTTLDRHAWVYADTANLVGGRVRGEEGDAYAVYAWPQFIDRYWNLVYTNGSAAVYARSH